MCGQRREVLFDLFFSPQTFLSSLNTSPINEHSVQSILFCFDFCPCHNNPRVLFHISLHNLFLKLSLRISENSLVGLGVITHLEPDILECEVKWASNEQS